MRDQLRRDGLETFLARMVPPQTQHFGRDAYTGCQIGWCRPPVEWPEAKPVEKGRFDPLSYLAVADGLAVERRLWPQFVEPGDVKPITAAASAPVLAPGVYAEPRYGE